MKLQLLLILSFLYINSFSQSVVSCNVYGCSPNPQEWIATEWKINGDLQDYTGCGDPAFEPSIHVAVIDSTNCQAWGTYNCESGNCEDCTMTNANHQFGNFNNGCGSCRARVEKYFIFRQNDSISMAYLDSMLTNPMLSGHNLLMYSFNCIDFDYLNTNYPNTIQIFQNLGFTNAATTDSVRPFIYFTEVGNTSSSIEVYGPTTPSSFITLTVPLTNCATPNAVQELEISEKIFPTLVSNGDLINVNFDEIYLYDISGKQLQTRNIPSNTFPVQDLTPGIYILKINKGNSFFTEKIVVTD